MTLLPLVLPGAECGTGLDLEYRYWAFMESHPAHAPLPSSARSDALDALTWSYTGKSAITMHPCFSPLKHFQIVSCRPQDLFHHRLARMNAKN